MFITLRFGDDNTLLVNPNCAAKNILDFIREKCECEKDALVDVCDETGSVKYLHDQPEMDVATDIFENKATYIPLVIERNEDHSVKKFIPLLQGANKVYPGLKKKLREQCSRTSNEPERSVRIDVGGPGRGKKTNSVMDINKGGNKRAGSTKKRA